MPGKRKANDMSSAEPEQKLSKKAKLRLARERAAAFAQRDKANIESRKGKKSGVVGRNANTQSKLAKNDVEEKSVKTMTGTAVATKSPNKKLALTERKKIALKNAKDFAAQDRAGLEAKKKDAGAFEAPPKYQQIESRQEKPLTDDQKQNPPISSTTSQSKLAKPQYAATMGPSPMEVISNTIYPSQLPGVLPNHQNFGAAIDPNQVEAYERMRQMQYVILQQQLATQQQKLMQQHVAATNQKLLRANQQHLQVAAAAQHELSSMPPMNMVIPSESMVSGENDNASLSSPGTTAIIGKKDNDNSSVEEMNEEDMPPPPPALMAQVSQQVLLNAQNEDSDSMNPVSVEDERKKEGKGDEMIASGNSKVLHPKSIDGNDKHLEQKKAKTRWLPKITSVIIAAVAIFSMILMLPAPSTKKTSSPGDTVISKESVCYFNSESEHEGDCLNDSSGIECPKGGVCRGGKLVACDNIFQDVSDQGDKCVLGENYFPMKAALMNQLVTNASQICDQSAKPSFKYTTMQKDEPTILEEESEDLIEALMDEGFIIYERDGLYVGLPEGFKVNLPIYCFLGNVGQWILQEVGLLLLGMLRFASSNLLGFVSTYPKLSALYLVLLVCCVGYRKYSAGKKQRREEISRTRELAYRTLEESCGVEHCAIHIRDEIAMALYPNSKKLRLKLQKDVWPKIVDDVKRDTRVRKFQTFNKDGKTRDMWQWTAANKTPSQT